MTKIKPNSILSAMLITAIFVAPTIKTQAFLGDFGDYAAAVAAGNTNPLAASGTADNPWIVQDCIDLQYIQTNDPDAASGSGSGSGTGKGMDNYYKVDRNIDCSDTASGDQGGTDVWTGTNGFVPIGDDNARFTGNFDGNYKIIRNLSITPSTEHYGIGLFGHGFGATIENVVIDSITIAPTHASSNTAGGIIGNMSGGILQNSSVNNATITAYNSLGGIVASMGNSAQLINVSANATISGAGIGGIAANTSTSSITNAYSSGTISVTTSGAGGIVGGLDTSSTLSNAYSTMTINGVGKGLASFVSGSATVNNSYFDSDTVTCNGGACSDVATYGTGTTYLTGQEGDAFAAWDFSTPIWEFAAGENNGYPIFEWQNIAPATPTTPSPSDAATGVAVGTTLTATYSDTDTSDVVTNTFKVTTTTIANNAACDSASSTVAGSTNDGAASNTGTTTFTPSSDLSNSTTYYWCVRSNDGIEDSEWAGPFSFTTAGVTVTTSIEDAETTIASASISTKKKTRAQGYIDHIQAVKGEDFNEALDINDPDAPEVTNALSQVAKNVRTDAGALAAIATAVEIFIGLNTGDLSGATYTQIHSAILNWRLQ